MGSLRLVRASTLAKLPPITDHELVGGFSARKRLTALTAWPKRGKSFTYCGLLRARQDGATWFGRQCRPGRTCVLTEEDRDTFAEKVRQFGIRDAALVTLHAPELPTERFTREAWPALLEEAAQQARAAGCDTLDMDTLTGWAPWAVGGGAEAITYCLRTLKATITTYDLAGTVVLHNRKQGGEAILAALGSIAGAAAVDVIAGFDREKASGVCTLTVEGRFGEWEQKAHLVGQRYVPIGTPPAPSPPLDPTSYTTYLQTPAWRKRQDDTLARAGGTCEACRAAPAVLAHHLTYERLGAERLGDLQALCAPCHNRAHPATPAEPSLPSHITATRERLRALDRPAAVDELAALEGVTRVPMLTRLKALEAAGLVLAEGSGKRGDPKRWRLR